MSEPQGVAPELGRLERADRIRTRRARGADGLGCHRRDRDPGEVTGAQQSGQLDRVTTVRFHAVARLVGQAGGRDDPAPLAFWGQVAGEPVPPGSGFSAKHQALGVGVQLADGVSKVAWPRANGPKVDDLGVVAVGTRGDGHRLCMHIQPAGQRARRAHGCPPSAWGIVHGTMHEAALASGKLPRVRHGGQPTPRKS
jgi:hypothetical protein